MTIEFRCAQCNQLLRVPDASAGKNARCPKCQLLMQIPAPATANIPPPPPVNFAPPPPPTNFAPPPPGETENPFDFTSKKKSNSRSGVHQSGQQDFFAGMPGNSTAQPAGYNTAPPPPPQPNHPANPFDFGAGSTSTVSASSSAPQSGAKKKTGRQGLPWEKGKKKGLEAFIETVKLVAFEPSKAFSMMLQKGDMGGPMLYSGIGLEIGFIGLEVWHMLAVLMLGSSLGIPPEAIGAYLGMMLVLAIGNLVIGVPLAATVGNFISGGILHVCLLICGGSKHPYDTSFRIACYVQSSLMWVCWIPGGVLVLGIWSIAVSIFAVHKAHEVPMGRAVLTVLLPIIVVMVLFGIIVAIFFATIMALLSQLPR